MHPAGAVTVVKDGVAECDAAFRVDILMVDSIGLMKEGIVTSGFRQ